MAHCPVKKEHGCHLFIAGLIQGTGFKEQGINPREWLTNAIVRMLYYQKPGNEEILKKLLPNYWRKQESNESLIKV